MTTPPAPPNASIAAFIEVAVRSGLLDRAQLTKAVGAVAPPGQNPETLAGHLVAGGQLSRFQADKLLLGRWQALIVGPYQLLCPIGRGGMGVVYLARDNRPKSLPLVAVKLLPPKRAREEPRTLARFRREMEIGRRLPQHPCLVRTLDAGENQGVVYLAMEYASGNTARQLVTTNGPMTVAAAARIFADVAAGLHAIHQAGYVHRDVKPGNIVVSANGRGKVLDFGFVVKRGEKPDADPSVLGGRGYTLGTLDFLPPEQALDAIAVSAETDIYSLGCSLYYVLAGRPPFPNGTVKEKIRSHRDYTPESLNVLNSAIPEDFARVVSWLMAKRPEERPHSAAIVASELERWATPAIPEVARRIDNQWIADALREVESRWEAYHRAANADVTLLGPNEGLDDEFIILDEDDVLIILEDLPESSSKKTRTERAPIRAWFKKAIDVSNHPVHFIMLSIGIILSLFLLVRLGIVLRR